MILLLISIMCSSGIYVIFKYFDRFGIDTFQAIVINYYVAAAFGFWYLGGIDLGALLSQGWLWWALGIGLLFISLFYLMALTSQQLGVTVASIASKMSLLIPVVILISIDPDEGMPASKLIGVGIGVLAVILASMGGSVRKSEQSLAWLLPAVLFLGSGGLDFLLAMVQKQYLSDSVSYKQFVPIPFAVAGLSGTLIWPFTVRKAKKALKWRNAIAGLVLGLVNYGSIYFVLRVIGSGVMDRSSAIPANNIGVVLLSALLGVLLFRERLSAKNVAGVLLAVVSIALLTYFRF